MFLCSWFWWAVGVSLFLGVVLACPPCFLGFGVLLVSRFFLLPCGLVVGGGGSGCWGVFSGSGLGAPGSCSLWGVGWVRLARPVPAFLCGGWVRVRLVLAPLCFGGWGLGVFVRLVHSWDAVSGDESGGPALFWGLGVPGFLVRVRGVFWSCSRRGFRVFLFPLGASLLWFGGCRVGLGLFFSGCYCLVRAGAGSSLVVGLVLVWVWFCLESLILAQDERWRRA